MQAEVCVLRFGFRVVRPVRDRQPRQAEQGREVFVGVVHPGRRPHEFARQGGEPRTVQRGQAGEAGFSGDSVTEREERAVDVEEQDRETGHPDTVGLIA
ncbi:hypothetical protein GCM10022267_48970 [Lentzea roselyniae]|uniref:Uncharacterized protein n=1 Tax=Lentzea roselyniae TaxID=531940 RepID=A0ABP7BCY1_9PSEU